MKYSAFIPVLFFSFTAHTRSANPSPESLSNLMNALSQVISEKTQIPGKKEDRVQLTPPAQAAYQTMQNDLEACQTSKTTEPQTVTIEKNGVSMEFKKFDLKIYGEQCPLEMSANLATTDEAQDRMEGTFSVKLTFKKQNYIDKYRLKFAEISGSLGAQAQQDGTLVKVPVHIEMNGKGESLDIGAFSQSSGVKVLLEVNLAQFSFNMMMEQTALMQYQDVSKKGFSQVKMLGFNQPEEIYTIDEKPVSKSEFELFLKSFIMPGMISDDEPDTPDQQAITQCTFAVYEKERISADALKTQMQSATLQSEGLLNQGQSCMKDISVPFSKNANSYTGQMTFGKEWISFTSKSSSSEKLSGGVYVLYGDSAVQINTSEELLMGLKCQPVPACP